MERGIPVAVAVQEHRVPITQGVAASDCNIQLRDLPLTSLEAAVALVTQEMAVTVAPVVVAVAP